MRAAPSSVLISQIAEIEGKFDKDVLQRHAAIQGAHTHSEETLKKIREEVSGSPPDSTVYTMATAGSLARLEASQESDLDLIIVTQPPAGASEEHAHQSIGTWRKDLCDRLKIELPNPTGVFIKPISYDRLTKIAGQSEESYDSVAKRILFLLESQHIYNQDNFTNLRDQIVDAYVADVSADPRKNFVFLLNDVVRFFRSLCVNYQFNKEETQDGKWPIRNIKLRHSRVLMYFSMVAAIGALSRDGSEQKIDALKHLITLPPLKRLYVAYGLSEDRSFFKVAGYYNSFLQLLSKREIRKDLANLDYDKRYESPVFAQLKANSDALSSELLRFYEARRQQWDDRFFEYMII